MLDLAPRQVGMAAALCGVAVVALAVAGRGLQEQRFGVLEAGLIALGVGLAVTAAIIGGSREHGVERSARRRDAPRALLVGAAVVLAAGAWLTSSHGVYTRVNVLLWLASLMAVRSDIAGHDFGLFALSRSRGE